MVSKVIDVLVLIHVGFSLSVSYIYILRIKSILLYIWYTIVVCSFLPLSTCIYIYKFYSEETVKYQICLTLGLAHSI